MRLNRAMIIGSFVLIALTLFAARFAASVPTAADDRVFEIRTYTTNPGKLPDLLKRFREHTTALFEKHGMTNIGYWVPTDEPRSKNTLIYILAHPSAKLPRRTGPSSAATPIGRGCKKSRKPMARLWRKLNRSTRTRRTSPRSNNFLNSAPQLPRPPGNAGAKMPRT